VFNHCATVVQTLIVATYLRDFLYKLGVCNVDKLSSTGFGFDTIFILKYFFFDKKEKQEFHSWVVSWPCPQT
jgi:hypothetical protein